MAGNSFGDAFRITTFGESHGAAIGVIIDGCPPGLPFTPADLHRDLSRRRPGQSRHVTQRRESDEAEILSGIFGGITTGAPVALLIRNIDARPKDYAAIKETFRPGHADFAYFHKYGIRDYRGGGRSSARETAARVAAGALARVLLSSLGVKVQGCMEEMGGIKVPFVNWRDTAKNPFFAANNNAAMQKQLADKITQLRRDGDSCGAIVRVNATGIPAGWGEPVFDRLDADIAKALMSINAVKGVEIGEGFGAAAMTGSAHNDEITPAGFATNHSGGILGGISIGADINARIAIKPTSSICKPQRTITESGKATKVQTTGRHDPCVGIRAVPVAEAMLLLVLADHAMRHRAQCGCGGGGTATTKKTTTKTAKAKQKQGVKR